MTADNVLLVTIDSLRSDHLSSMGYHRETSPTIDRVAKDGLTFTQAVSNGPSTRSSFPSILTGTYPLMFGGYTYLSDERPFLARELSSAGFQTAAFHSNPHVGAPQNYDIGFDSFCDTAEGSDEVASLKDRVERVVPSDSHLYSLLRRAYHLLTMSTDTEAYARAPTINQQAKSWLDDEWNGEDRFFLWIHYMDVHYPFTPAADSMEELGLDTLSKRRVADLNGRMHEDPDSLTEEDVTDLCELYDGEIRYTDQHVSRLLSDLESRGIRDETAVIICADHGEGFGEHGRFGHHPHLYDELLRVPLIVDAPSISPREDESQVSLVDIAPTIYDLTGVPTPGDVQGESLLSVIDEEEERVAISASSGENVMARNIDEWKYFATRTTDWKCFWRRDIDTVELYDLNADPRELEDVSESNPEVVERFCSSLTDHLETAKATELDIPSVQKSDTVKQRLRDLGYTE